MANKSGSGFLSTEINDCIPMFRKRFAPEYELIDQINEFYYDLQNCFVGQEATLEIVYYLTALTELHKLYQSVILLLERGLDSSANIVMRSAIELSLKLLEAIRNPDQIDAFIAHDEETHLKISKEFRKNSGIEIEVPISNDKVSSEHKKYKHLTTRELAEQNDCGPLYTVYKLLCDDTHQSPYVLGQHIEKTETGVLVDAGFQLENFRESAALLISIAINPIPKLLCIIPSDDSLGKQYKMIENSYMNIFRDLVDHEVYLSYS